MMEPFPRLSGDESTEKFSVNQFADQTRCFDATVPYRYGVVVLNDDSAFSQAIQFGGVGADRAIFDVVVGVEDLGGPANSGALFDDPVDFPFQAAPEEHLNRVPAGQDATGLKVKRVDTGRSHQHERLNVGW